MSSLDFKASLAGHTKSSATQRHTKPSKKTPNFLRERNPPLSWHLSCGTYAFFVLGGFSVADGKRMLSILQISHNKDSWDYSFDKFSRSM